MLSIINEGGFTSQWKVVKLVGAVFSNISTENT